MHLLTSPSAYYSLNGNSNKSYGTYNGTDNNGVTYGVGKINQCAIYDGTNDYTTIQASTDFYFGTADFGVSFWVKRNDNGRRQVIMGQADVAGANTANSITIEFNSTDYLITAFCSGNNYYSVPNVTTTTTDTNWHHVVFTRTSGVFKTYLDTTLLGTLTNSSSINSSTKNFSFGRSGEYNGLYFNGSICEVGFWKQSLESNVSELYRLGKGVTWPFYNNNFKLLRR